MSHDDYLDLCRVARDALADLLEETDHHRGVKERAAYGSVVEYIEKYEETEADDHDSAPLLTRPGFDSHDAERGEREQAWSRWPMERKRAMVLDVLGDDRLTGKELAQRYREAVKDDFDVYQDQVLYIVGKMLGSEVDRELEPWSSRGRYRYFRKVGLEGPIADLQRQLDAENAGGRS